MFYFFLLSGFFISYQTTDQDISASEAISKSRAIIENSKNSDFKSKTKEISKAVEILTSVIRKQKNHIINKKDYELSDLYYNRGDCYFQIRDYKNAINDLRESIGFNKCHIQALTKLALIEVASPDVSFINVKDSIKRNNLAIEEIKTFIRSIESDQFLNEKQKKDLRIPYEKLYNECLIVSSCILAKQGFHLEAIDLISNTSVEDIIKEPFILAFKKAKFFELEKSP